MCGTMWGQKVFHIGFTTKLQTPLNWGDREKEQLTRMEWEKKEQKKRSKALLLSQSFKRAAYIYIHT